jgi:hypothetical protein
MSSESDSGSDSGSEQEQERDCLTLTVVQDCIREYEKERRKERKVRCDILANKEEVVVAPESFKNLTLTKKQLAQIKKEQKEATRLADKVEKKERTEKQKQAIAELNARKAKQLDLRKNKEEEGITLKMPKKRAPNKPKPVVEEEEEAEPVRYQRKKPKLEEEIEEKVTQLQKLNSIIETNNPFYAMIMKDRMGKMKK